MDDLVTEMLETVETYRQKGVESRDRETGLLKYTLTTRDPVTGFSIPLELPLPDFKAPPAILEQELGITDIAERYRMPQGLGHKSLQEYVQVLRHAQMRGDISHEQLTGHYQEVFESLAERNPPLRQLRFNREDSGDLYHVLVGVASCFNMKDMQFWMDGHTFRDLQKNPETKNMLEQIDAHGGNVRWAPAPETLKDITRKITAPAVAEALRQRTMGPD